MYDLLFGLMLPSGNDAAIALAESLGALLLLKKNNLDKYISLQSIIDVE